MFIPTRQSLEFSNSSGAYHTLGPSHILTYQSMAASSFPPTRVFLDFLLELLTHVLFLYMPPFFFEPSIFFHWKNILIGQNNLRMLIAKQNQNNNSFRALTMYQVIWVGSF